MRSTHPTSYDALERLTQLSRTGSQALTEAYAYDPQGRRISKTSAGALTQYRYAGNDLYADYGPSLSTPRTLYLQGAGTDEPLLAIDPANAANRRYYHADGLGSLVAVTDSAGALQASRRYDSFGRVLASTGALPTYGYSGREPDASGLVYYRARYYAPELGRFTQADPIGLGGGINRYAYVGGDPVNFRDPSGWLATKVNPARQTAYGGNAVDAAIFSLQMQGVASTPVTTDASDRADEAPIVTMGRAIGGIAAYMVGMVTGDEALKQVAADGLAEDRQKNVEAFALVATMGRGGAAKGFASEAKLLGHFEKHGAEFGSRSADDYLQVGRDIMQYGTKVNYLYKGETRTGYAQFMGNTSRGDAKFGFVGTNADGAITTIHTQSGKSFWKMLNGDPSIRTITPAP